VIVTLFIRFFSQKEVIKILRDAKLLFQKFRETYSNKEIKLKVFVVDDSEILRERIVREISKIPRVEIIGEAETAQEAIDAIQIQKPDIVLLDIRLKIGNGIDVLYQVKKEEPSPIVIIFTGFHHPHYRKRCEEEKADYFFHKKDEFDKVIEVITDMSNKKEF
jgi:two-component system, NarL family, response regulator DevR